MSDLYALIVAELDRKTDLATVIYKGPWHRPWPDLGDVVGPGPVEICAADNPEVGEAIATFASPDFVLRGLGQDRAILRRHVPKGFTVWTVGQAQPFFCTGCSDPNPDTFRIVDWPCWDVLSLARRHGISIEEEL